MAPDSVMVEEEKGFLVRSIVYLSFFFLLLSAATCSRLDLKGWLLDAVFAYSKRIPLHQIVVQSGRITSAPVEYIQKG
jgi:hypothetical protein